MLKMLSTRLNALIKISKNANFMTRPMVANACFLSIITYMIAVWGGTEGYVLRAVQVMQNKAARAVTKLSWFTPTRTLLLQYNWPSIKQLIIYHTALQGGEFLLQSAQSIFTPICNYQPLMCSTG